jgi:hypothetical protein
MKHVYFLFRLFVFFFKIALVGFVLGYALHVVLEKISVHN